MAAPTSRWRRSDWPTRNGRSRPPAASTSPATIRPGAASVISQQGTIAQIDAYTAATDAASSRLTVADSVLSDVITKITAAQAAALGVQGLRPRRRSAMRPSSSERAARRAAQRHEHAVQGQIPVRRHRRQCLRGHASGQRHRVGVSGQHRRRRGGCRRESERADLVRRRQHRARQRSRRSVRVAFGADHRDPGWSTAQASGRASTLLAAG